MIIRSAKASGKSGNAANKSAFMTLFSIAVARTPPLLALSFALFFAPLFGLAFAAARKSASVKSRARKAGISSSFKVSVLLFFARWGFID